MLVLQRINGNVFPDPAAVILNAAAVAEYLEKTGESHRTISYLKNDEASTIPLTAGAASGAPTGISRIRAALRNRPEPEISGSSERRSVAF